jgi:hypothetical protein
VVIAKSVAENYEDEELRKSYVDIATDLYVRISFLFTPISCAPFSANLSAFW